MIKNKNKILLLRLFILILYFFILLFYLNSTIEFSFLLLIFMFVFTYLFYGVNEKVIYLLSIFYLLLINCLYFLSMNAVLDKLSIVFLINTFLGLMRELICFNKKKLVKPKQLLNIIVGDLIKIKNIFKKTIINFLLNIIIFSMIESVVGWLFKLLFFLKLKSKKDLNLNKKEVILIFFKLLFLIFLFFCIFNRFIYQYHFFESYFIRNYFKIYFNKILIFQLIVFLVLFIIVMFVVYSNKRHIFKFFFSLLIVFIFFQYSSFNYKKKYYLTNPVITFLSSNQGKMWEQITIYGNNFGNAHYNNSDVFLNGEKHRILFWSDKKIIFIVDALKSKSGLLWVKNVDNKESNRLNFTIVE